jgi:hypothetical protein
VLTPEAQHEKLFSQVSDTEKKKYFKIDKNAPPTAAYSAESVKRRKIEHEKEKNAQVVAAQKERFVQRSRLLQDPLLGGLLANELGIRPKDLQVDCWARGLCYKGCSPVAESGLYHNNNPIEHLYISNSDKKTGLGVAIGCKPHSSLVHVSLSVLF